MIETLSGISAGSPTERKTMNSPRRSIFASSEIFIGGSTGISPSPCHSPISGSNSFIVGLLFRATAYEDHKKLGRIADDGGWRAAGCSNRPVPRAGERWVPQRPWDHT